MAGGPYRIVAVGRALGIGLEGSHEVTLQAVAKRNSADSPYCVANETICGEIGRFLRLPVPPCGIIYAPDTDPPYWFASLDFNLVGEALPPINGADFARRLPDIATGVIVFDLLVGNPDRHTLNLSMDTSSKPPRANLFDHGMALLGGVEGEGEEWMRNRMDVFLIRRHCLLRHLTTDTHFPKWLSRVSQLPDYFIEDICDEAQGMGVNKAEAAAAADFIKHRRDTILRLINANRTLFAGIKEWPLGV